MMQVLIVDGLLDRDYIDRYTLGFEALAARAAEYPPERVAAICGLRAEQVVALACDYGTTKPAAIRVNYGLQRHAGGGNAVRAIACLPALTGSWRDPAAAAPFLVRTYPVDSAALGGRLDQGKPRTINMSAIGDALLEAGIRRSARSTSITQPGRRRAESAKWRRASAQGSLCVVHEIFQTDTADYADILLPATTQLEHDDVHNSYGHLYAQENNAAIAPLGEARPNTEVFRLLAARMGFDEPCFRDSDDDLARQAFKASDPRASGLDWDSLRKSGFARLAVPSPWAPFAQGNFPTPSGKCEFFSGSLSPRATTRCRRSCRRANPSPAIPRLRSAIRWRSCRRPRATS
jgi:anaerobic selenocysteine-containing dehydrogenase